jgi:hypothetical protein
VEYFWHANQSIFNALMEKTWGFLEQDLPPFFVFGQEPFCKETSEAMAQSFGETLEDLVTVYDELAERGRQLSTLMTQRLEESKES